ncbi:MAG: hypothetical protein JW729_10860 [Bacteroidales bacterium]|nr:hypothetical protein [Bacteroidales bacterium]
MKQEIKHTKGYYIGLGLAIGIPLGIPFGLLLGNIAFGPAIGLPIGLTIGIYLENKLNKEPIALSQEDLKTRTKYSWLLFVIGLALFALFFIGFVLYK